MSHAYDLNCNTVTNTFVISDLKTYSSLRYQTTRKDRKTVKSISNALYIDMIPHVDTATQQFK